MTKKLLTILVLFFLLFSAAETIWAQTQGESYPELETLQSSRSNKVYARLMQDVEQYYMDAAAHRNFSVNIYRYKAQKGDTLIKIASRCGIPAETLASANSLGSSQVDIADKELFIPAAAGLFISEEPRFFLEFLVVSRIENYKELPQYEINGKTFYFAAGERFSMTERLYFFNNNLVKPLKDSVLTSEFGMRISPITGTEKMHNGIDLAAKAGSDVLCCQNGIVLESTYDDVYGNYVIVNHDSGLQSFYAHLQESAVKKGDKIAANQLVGYVGTTGASTGPHLHFELRQGNGYLDPQNLLPR